MNWLSISPYLPAWLRRHPLLLASVLAAVNRVQRLTTTLWRGTILAIAAVLFLGGLIIALLITGGRAALVMQTALSYGGIVVTASGLYAVSLIMRVRREVAAARVRSWLIATPRVDSHSVGTTALLVAIPLLWRYGVVLAAMFLLSLDSSVTLQQSLQLAALVAIGGAVGGLSASAFPLRRRKRRDEGSRYTLRPTRTAQLAPSSAALSHWPIAQAFAWSRPENARFLLAAAILTVPGGGGFFDALFILVTWVVVAYLVAVLVAIPYVARTASEWLRSTPMNFWAFAWPPCPARGLASDLWHPDRNGGFAYARFIVAYSGLFWDAVDDDIRDDCRDQPG